MKTQNLVVGVFRSKHQAVLDRVADIVHEHQGWIAVHGAGNLVVHWGRVQGAGDPARNAISAATAIKKERLPISGAIETYRSQLDAGIPFTDRADQVHAVRKAEKTLISRAVPALRRIQASSHSEVAFADQVIRGYQPVEAPGYRSKTILLAG